MPLSRHRRRLQGGGLSEEEAAQFRELLRCRDLTAQLAALSPETLQAALFFSPGEHALLGALNDRLEKYKYAAVVETAAAAAVDETAAAAAVDETAAAAAAEPPATISAPHAGFADGAPVWFVYWSGGRSVPAIVKRTRQLLPSRIYVIESEVTGAEKDDVSEQQLLPRGDSDCPVCLEPQLLCTLKPCGHGVCRADTERLGGTCPLCRTPFVEYVCRGERVGRAAAAAAGAGVAEDDNGFSEMMAGIDLTASSRRYRELQEQEEARQAERYRLYSNPTDAEREAARLRLEEAERSRAALWAAAVGQRRATAMRLQMEARRAARAAAQR